MVRFRITKDEGPGRPPSRSKVAVSIALAIVIFLGVELAFQVRAHLKTGQSAFNALSGETLYVEKAELGLTLLRPSSRFVGTDATIVTNRLGLRSPDIKTEKSNGTFRIAIVGASSVMGTYTRNNEQLLAYQLRDILLRKLAKPRFEVINAGIAGYTLTDQQALIERLLPPLRPDLIVLYTGFNDMSSYCRPGGSSIDDEEGEDYELPRVSLPDWFLSRELLVKNTVFIREPATERPDQKELSDLDLRTYRADLEGLVAAAKKTSSRVVLLTNPRAFTRDLPLDEQLRVSVTARFYKPCFSLSALHDVYDAHNDVIRQTARRARVHLLEFDRIIPGGSTYFGDATHLSIKGEAFAAARLADFLIREGLAGQR